MGKAALEGVDPRALGARLRRAREARGWTQEDAAKPLGMARTTMTAIEKGERQVRPEELLRLASLYGRSVAELLQRRAPVEGFGVQLRSAMRRGPVDLDLLPFIEEFEVLCDDYLRLEELCSAPMRRRYPPEYDIREAEPELLGEEVAAAERQRLGLGEGPLPDLRDLLESEVGLRIFQIDLPSNVAGLFAFTEDHGGCIAVNRKHPPERRRNTLGHEYGHFLAGRFKPEITVLGVYERRPADERFAETFGRALLLPSRGVRHRFLELKRERNGHPTHADLCRLAHGYGVSVEVMTRRLEELGLVPRGTWDRLQLQGFRPREAQQHLGLTPQTFGDDVVPPRYVFLAVEAWQRGDLSEGQLARLLRTDRLGARHTIERVELQAGAGSSGDDLDLARSFLGSGSG